MKHIKKLLIVAACVLAGCSDSPSEPKIGGEVVGAVRLPINTHAALITLESDGEILGVSAGTGREHVLWSEDKKQVLFIDHETPLATKIPLRIDVKGNLRAILVETATASGATLAHNTVVPLN